MFRPSLILPLAVVVAVALLCPASQGADSVSTQAADTVQPASESPEPLRVQLAIYSWLSSLSNTVKTSDSETTSDIDLSSILDALDFANFAHLEVQRDRWGLFSELDFVKLSEDTEFRSPRRGLPIKTHADLVIKQTMAELGVMRSFDGARVGFDALAGARYFRLESDVHVGPLESSITKDWVDPMVGGRLRLRFSDKWQGALRADLAGFGAGSELTTNIVATLGYSFSERYTLGFGYRYLEIDYEKGDVDLSMTTSGPVVGVIIRF